MSKDLDIETRQNTFQIYLVSYKKYKYWFAVFYFLSIVFWLIYNENISHKIEKYKTMQDLLNGKEYLYFFNGSNRPLNFKNIISNLEMKFSYKKINDDDWSKGRLQKKARQHKIIKNHADALNKYTDFKFNDCVDSLKQMLQGDSLAIEGTISHYDSLINRYPLHIITSDLKNNYRKEIRIKFIESVNLSQPQNNFKILPFKEIALNVLKKYPLPDSTYTKFTLQEIETQAKILVEDVKFWEKENIVDPQNFRIPLSFGSIKQYSLLILVIIAIFLKYHFINFKFYERQLINDNQKLIKVPSIYNIIENLKIPLLSHRYSLWITNILSYFVNLFVPMIVMCLLGKQVWKLLDNYTWFCIAIIIYIIGFSSLIVYIWQDQKVYVKIKEIMPKLLSMNK